MRRVKRRRQGRIFSMFRHHLLRGVSAGALALLCVSNGPGASALAQEALPAIDIDAASADGGNGAPPLYRLNVDVSSSQFTSVIDPPAAGRMQQSRSSPRALN